MAKVILSDLTNLQNEASAVSTINTNNGRIEDALDKTLSRDGSSPNSMEANIDLNGFTIFNLRSASAPTEAVRKQEFDLLANKVNEIDATIDIVEGLAADAAASANAAAISAEAAEDQVALAAAQVVLAEDAADLAEAYAESINPTLFMPKTGGVFTGSVQISTGGDAFFTSGSTQPLTVYTNVAADPAIYRKTGTALRLGKTTDGIGAAGFVEQMRLHDNGSVSIGGTTAGAELEVHALGGDSDVRVQLRANGTHTAQLGCSTGLVFIDSGQSKPFAIYTNSVSQLLIDGTTGVASFTAIPTAPTATPGTNNTQLATTAFVQANATSKWTTIADTTLGSASASQVFNLGGFKEIRFTIRAVPNSAVADDFIGMTISTDGGSTYLAGTGYANQQFTAIGATVAAAATTSAFFNLSGTVDSATPSAPAQITGTLSTTSGTVPVVRSSSLNFNGSNYVFYQNQGVNTATTSLITHIKITTGTGVALMGAGTRFIIEGC